MFFSGVFHKGEHKKVFAYLTNVACDKNNYVIGFVLNSGNKHDSTEFPKLYEQLKNRFEKIKNVVVDAGYKTPAIAKQVLDDYRTLVTPYKRPMTKFSFFKKYEFVYDEYYDVYICPSNEVLKYSTTNRDGYKEYKSNKIKCKNCQYLSECTESKDHQKVVTRHVWEEYMEKLEDIRHNFEYRKLYKKRSETIERVFADAKELHNLRYTRFKGIKRNKDFLYLLFSCMNLKKMATKTWDNTYLKPIFSAFSNFFIFYFYFFAL